ncbi:uncharacterized protein LOC131433932 [Malaya genurostris]|uniref:uncharacterized protein LOC131433932 n=1 Tax=Malaya genurostris TaxID=325434 RepID=UPI0026F39FE9|nr:uncharacterized protein LOC131433932 [Malaya genurostris]
MVWIRPANVPYPSVWHTFKAKDIDSDRLVNYVVQDLPEERFTDAVNHMLGIFIYDEPMCRAKKLAEDPASVESIRVLWQEMVKQRLVLVCFREGSDEIVGVNMTYAASKDDSKDYTPTAKLWRDVYDAVDYFYKHSQDSVLFDTVLSALGLSVSPKYRGRGIATEILRARVPLCRAVGLKQTTTIFTAPASQVAAAKVGFKETLVMRYEELAQLDPRFHFPGTENTYCKSMSLMID